MPSRGIDRRNTFRGLTVPHHQNEFIPEVTQEWLRFETGVVRLPICFLAIRSAHDGRTIDGDVQRVLSAVTGNRLAIDIRANVLVLETAAGTGHRDSDSEPKFVAAAVAQIGAKGMNRIGEAADLLAAVELSENDLHFERNFCHWCGFWRRFRGRIFGSVLRMQQGQTDQSQNSGQKHSSVSHHYSLHHTALEQGY